MRPTAILRRHVSKGLSLTHPSSGQACPEASRAQIAYASADMQAIMMGFAFLICALFLFAAPAFAQSVALTIPENARAKTYGDGWNCNRGYRRDGDVCVVVIVPENAYQTNLTYGSGWECLHGFRAGVDGDCIAVIVPDGGFLDPSGEQWNCLRGYLKVADHCQEIVLPENAYLSDEPYGPPWTCKRGFEAKEDVCSAIAVPVNAYLNSSEYGKPWTCERGFLEQGDVCEEVVIPAHAYFDDATYGTGWKCGRGYAVAGNSCEVIDMPANAHLDRSGNRWACDRSFKRSNGQCVLNN